MTTSDIAVNQIRRLNEIGIALSAERNADRLLEQVLDGARELTGADGGTLYLIEPETASLRFALVQNSSLGIRLGGADNPVPERFGSIPLHLPDGSASHRTIAAHAVLNNLTINIADAYHEPGFDFSGTRHFDQLNHYRSTSFLTVPMRNHEGDVIAAIQLINKLDDRQQPQPFDDRDQELAESLASQGAVALTNARLITELRTLFDSFTRVIASAIDAKSAQTGAHCRRVPELTLMIARAADGAEYPGLEGFRMEDADYYELSTAAWLHDCGKIVTPHHIVEKSTKLELLQDGIHHIADRFEIAIRDMKLAHIARKLAAGETPTLADVEGELAETAALRNDLAFLKRSNLGGEFMSDDDIERIQRIANTRFTNLDGDQCSLLTAEEVEYLSIRRGTLNGHERKIMEDHMVHTVNMLEQLPFPRHLKRVPEYAGGHHERMDGTGYPRGLKRDQMSVPARIMGIADVFEALTAPERSYKKAMPISQALGIMARMVDQSHLDPDLFSLFVERQVYQDYARQFLTESQLDEVPDSVLDTVSRIKSAGAIT